MQPKHILCDLSEYGIVKVSGPDAKKFLQGQLTCHLEQVTSAQGCLGAHCNPKGRIISLFYLLQLENAYYLIMPRNMVAIALTALKKYAVFFKAALTDATDSLFIMGHNGLALNQEHTAKIQLPHTSRFIVIGTREQILPIWNELKASTDLKTFSDWSTLDIKEMIPTIYPETSGKFLPHEINLQELGALNFEKGCYTGQEIIARMHYRGKLKTRMQSIEITSDTSLLPGSDIQWKDASATIVAASQEEYNKYYALVITEAK